MEKNWRNQFPIVTCDFFVIYNEGAIASKIEICEIRFPAFSFASDTPLTMRALLEGVLHLNAKHEIIFPVLRFMLLSVVVRIVLQIRYTRNEINFPFIL